MSDAYGQLYAVEIRAKLRENGAYERTAYIVCGRSTRDVEDKIKWHIDIKQFTEFSIKSIDKIKPFHRLWSRIEPAEDRKVRKSKPAGKRQSAPMFTYAVGITGYMIAASDEHAAKKLGNYLLNRASHIDTSLPILDGGQVVLEQQGEADGTVVRSADREGAINLEGKALPGGLPSLGKGRP